MQENLPEPPPSKSGRAGEANGISSSGLSGLLEFAEIATSTPYIRATPRQSQQPPGLVARAFVAPPALNSSFSVGSSMNTMEGPLRRGNRNGTLFHNRRIQKRKGGIKRSRSMPLVTGARPDWRQWTSSEERTKVRSKIRAAFNDYAQGDGDALLDAASRICEQFLHDSSKSKFDFFRLGFDFSKRLNANGRENGRATQ